MAENSYEFEVHTRPWGPNWSVDLHLIIDGDDIDELHLEQFDTEEEAKAHTTLLLAALRKAKRKKGA